MSIIRSLILLKDQCKDLVSEEEWLKFQMMNLSYFKLEQELEVNLEVWILSHISWERPRIPQEEMEQGKVLEREPDKIMMKPNLSLSKSRLLMASQSNNQDKDKKLRILRMNKTQIMTKESNKWLLKTQQTSCLIFVGMILTQ